MSTVFNTVDDEINFFLCCCIAIDFDGSTFVMRFIFVSLWRMLRVLLLCSVEEVAIDSCNRRCFDFRTEQVLLSRLMEDGLSRVMME